MRLKRPSKKTAIALTVMVVAGGIQVPAAPVESILYRFQSGLDGAQPYGALLADHAGNLFGTTVSGGAYGYGTVYELTRPSGAVGSLTEKVLYSFQGGNDGAQPYSTLVFDDAGNLYGTTNSGGNGPDCYLCGTVFKLSPPANPGGSWTESVLYTFDGADGAYPYAGLNIDEDGNLYGTTYSGGVNFEGTVFELSPPNHPGGTWKEKVLYSFTGGADGGLPYAGVLRRAGVLYATTILGGAYGYGAVFQLSRAGGRGNWSESVLYSFTGGTDGAEPFGGVLFDRQGRLYGTTASAGNTNCGGVGCGTVYQLTPPAAAGAAWVETTLYGFTGGLDGGVPFDNLTAGREGALYGTASSGGGSSPGCIGYCGTVFQLTPPASTQSPWVESTVYEFNGATDGAYPASGLLLNQGVLYGTTTSGGDPNNDGAVFRIIP